MDRFNESKWFNPIKWNVPIQWNKKDQYNERKWTDSMKRGNFYFSIKQLPSSYKFICSWCVKVYFFFLFSWNWISYRKVVGLALVICCCRGSCWSSWIGNTVMQNILNKTKCLCEKMLNTIKPALKSDHVSITTTIFASEQWPTANNGR